MNVSERDKKIRTIRSKIQIIQDIRKLELLIEQAQERLNINPTDACTLYMLGLSYSLSGRLDEAESIALNYLQFDSNDAHAHSLYGYILSCKSNYKIAIVEYEKAIELDPSDSYFYINLAICYFMLDNKKNLYKSIDLVIKALELNPDDAASNSYQLEQFLNTEFLSDDEKDSLKTLGLAPDQFEHLQTYSINFDNKKEYSPKTLSLDSSDSTTHKGTETNNCIHQDLKSSYYFEKMKAYMESDNINEAYAFALKYIKEYPQEGHAYYCYGKILYSKNKLPQAIEALKKSISLENSNNTTSLAYYALARCIYENNKNDIIEAIEMLKKALTISPYDIDIRIYLSDLYLYCANYGAAESECLSLLSLEQDVPDILGMWAKVLFYSANFDESNKYINKTLELAPDNPIALSVKAEMDKYLKNSRPMLKKMIKSFYQYIREFPNNEKGYLMLARAYMRLGSYKRATSSIKKYLEFKPNDYYELSSCLKQLCKFGKKERVLEFLIKINTQHHNNKAIENTIEALYREGVTCKRKKLFGIF